MKEIVFKQDYRYSLNGFTNIESKKGEKAVLPDETAERFIKQGVAEFIDMEAIENKVIKPKRKK